MEEEEDALALPALALDEVDDDEEVPVEPEDEDELGPASAFFAALAPEPPAAALLKVRAVAGKASAAAAGGRNCWLDAPPRRSARVAAVAARVAVILTGSVSLCRGARTDGQSLSWKQCDLRDEKLCSTSLGVWVSL